MVEVFENYDLNFIEETGPCEFCGESFPLGTLIEHQTLCNPRITSYAPGAFDFDTASESSDNEDYEEHEDLETEIPDSFQNKPKSLSAQTSNRSQVTNELHQNSGTSVHTSNSESIASSSGESTTNNGASRSKSPTPSIVETLNKNDPSIFTLKKSRIFNAKTKENGNSTNSQKSAPVEDIEESLFRSFTKNKTESLENSEPYKEEELVLSSDEDADETIEQFWERAQEILKKRLYNMPKKNMQNKRNITNEENWNYEERSGY